MSDNQEEGALPRQGLYTLYKISTGVIVRSGFSPNLDGLREHLEEDQGIWDGEALSDTQWRVVDDQKVPYVEPVDLGAVERELLAEIDQVAESVRGRFITNTASQPAVYLAKEGEATALLADPALAPELTPNLTLEAARLGSTRLEVAAVILSKAQMWRQISAQIENLRLASKEAVRAASTLEGKRAAARVDWSEILALAEN